VPALQSGIPGPVGASPEQETEEIPLKTLNRAILILLVSTLFAGPVLAAQAAKKLPAHCDKACLTGAVNNYIAALVAHDPSQVPLSAHVEFVENTRDLKPGEGLWKTASAPPTTFKIYVPDPVSEEVGFMGVMQSDNKPIILALRLKIRGGQIVAAEHLIAPIAANRPTAVKNLEEPRRAFLTPVPASERNSRADMIRIASMYYPALTHADANNAPFADDCVRHENGMQTTTNPKPEKITSAMQILGSLGCTAQLKTHSMDYIARIEPVRVMIADPEMGLVLGLSQFRQPMKEKSEKLVGVPGYTSQPMNFKAFDLPAAHIFKVYDGKIHEIEAMGFTMPYDSKTGWENYADHGH
jgi:hypothetical protein